ncbi:MAG: SDR family oxidoreductase [Vulcanimicrobiota bacterium]
MKKILVSGGAGFIGSHLVDRLLSEGHQVIAVDNLSTGRIKNLQQALATGRLQFVEADINQADVLNPLCQGVETVFHLAALADIVPSIENPLAYTQANVSGTMVLLEAARKAGVARFVYAASSSCYGLPDLFPTPEVAEIRPQYPYALSKYLGEQSVHHWGQVYGMSTISLRFFNVYGPRARTSGTYGAVFGVFLRQKLANKPFTVVGDGQQSRDFTYVSDVTDALVQAAASKISGEAYNVGSGGSYTINSLVDLLGGERVYIPKRPGEPDCTFADLTKIREQLGWNPKVSFQEGVSRVLDCINDWSDAPLWTPSSIEVATRDWFRYLGSSTPGGN